MKRQTEYKEIYSDKSKTLGQKEVEQMKRTREMSNEERKQSKKAQKVGKLKTSGREAPGT